MHTSRPRILEQSMNHRVRIGSWLLYGGMRLRDNPCDVFYDNPLFSELLSPNPGNPGGTKTWGRFVRQTHQINSAFVPDQPGGPEDWQRLEREWQRSGGHSLPLERLWGGWRDVEERPDLPWLIAAPRGEILQYWYGITLEAWLNLVTTQLQALGHAWHLRPKPDRRQRNRDPQARILWTAPQYRGTITAHSVSAIDTILAGRPAVVWGQDPTLGLATPWPEFQATGQVRLPWPDDVECAAETWAATTWPTLETERAVTCIMNS